MGDPRQVGVRRRPAAWSIATATLVYLGVGAAVFASADSPCSGATLREATELLGEARAVLEDVSDGGDAEPGSGPCVAFIGASDGQRAATTVVGRGESRRLAVLDAAGRLRSRLRQARQPSSWLKLDLVGDEVHRVGQTEAPTPRSLFGLAARDWTAALLPEELVSYRIVDSRQRFRQRRLEQFLMANGWRTGPELPGWAWRFNTVSVFWSEDTGVRPLFRGQRVDFSLERDELLRHAAAAGVYLVRTVTANGRFEYEFLPKSDRLDDDYNLLRHAGAVYSMLELYRWTRDRQLLDSALRAIDYLTQQLEPCPEIVRGAADDVVHDERFGLCAVEDDESKLGGNGLAVLAILELPREELTPYLRSRAVLLGERILTLLETEGRFRLHKVRWSDGAEAEFQSEYYPGEATYALTRLHRLTGESRWLEAARRAASYRVDVRYAEDGAFDQRSLPHDHWLAYALLELGELSPRKEDARYALRLASSIAMLQHDPDSSETGVEPDGKTHDQDWRGGFYTPPRSAPTATRAEALASILRMLTESYPGVESPEQLANIERSLCAAVEFQLRTQFGPERAFYLRDPQRALGGISRSLTDFSIRIDYPQHTSSSLVATAYLMDEGVVDCETGFLESPDGP